jgi:hypothetical protein
MTSKKFLDNWLLLLTAFIFLSWNQASEKYDNYNLHYTTCDTVLIREYKDYTETGIKTVENFFRNHFPQNFEIFIHPDRESLDKQWQTDWNMPDFKSECWMVASGVNTKLDILAPYTWDSLACEHSSKNKIKIQRIFTHELVHVYHGQHNISPDFSNTIGIDWFIEGLATYVSGQCDKKRILEVKDAIVNGNSPTNLDSFWKGNLRYGQSGTMLLFISSNWKQEKLFELLQYNTKSEILKSLGTTEDELIKQWLSFMRNFNANSL